MLYETSGKTIAIDDELKIMHDYIALEKLRYDDSLKISLHTQIENTKQLLPPLLLIPLVENAFKHGVGLVREPFIKIELSLVDNKLIFNVKNKFSAESNEEKDDASGIGLRNVMRRLELLYGENHQLFIEQDRELFNVHLTIHLKSITQNE